ncbi:MAG: DnaJ domain-containing protein, partial [Myxococcales bacterium]|nr:DnaJ domain-containing protein [Myxococcales bacterium]
MSSLHERIPCLIESADLAGLPLGPREMYVLSRIDGILSVAEIADMTGLSTPETLTIVQSFALHGAVDLRSPSNRPRGSMRPSSPGQVTSARPTGPAPRDDRDGARSSSASSSGQYSMPPGAISEERLGSERPKGRAASINPSQRAIVVPQGFDRKNTAEQDSSALEEKTDLDPERCREIQEAHGRLGNADYYVLLGVSRDAPKQEIRTAFFTLSKRFHPDTLYGKELGSYRGKMEEVFQRLTEAYEILGRAKKRAAYDRYLAVHSPQAPEAKASPPPQAVRPAAEPPPKSPTPSPASAPPSFS